MDGVFSGVRIIEFGMFVAGPYASEMFAHGGADVIKVEPVTATRRASTAPSCPARGAPTSSRRAASAACR